MIRFNSLSHFGAVESRRVRRLFVSCNLNQSPQAGRRSGQLELPRFRWVGGYRKWEADHGAKGVSNCIAIGSQFDGIGRPLSELWNSIFNIGKIRSIVSSVFDFSRRPVAGESRRILSFEFQSYELKHHSGARIVARADDTRADPFYRAFRFAGPDRFFNKPISRGWRLEFRFHSAISFYQPPVLGD